MNQLKSFIYSLESIEEVAKSLIFQYPTAFKWAVYGPMGSGKTTLIKKIAKQLGSVDEGSSPTFALVNQYDTLNNKMIYHLDLFRLNSLDEAFNAGIYEIIQSDQCYCFVEWPELIQDWMDESWLRIDLSRLDEFIRTIRVL
jgi:tRNA threonylcarbamoyladenosine biosynthesis protein TsaE